ncbi:MAG: hypothetical protein B6I25_01670 [Planctomycetales bacterium 4572_13]|nr:MAG: hypothetical protein B6I25_01670 [Planctomycetales bacterium 4572_13]
MYHYQTTIRLHQTDAAGVVFFSHLFVIAHDAYESFLESRLPLNAVLSDGKYIIPIVRAQADYLLPLALSEKICVELSLDQIGESSFSLNYIVKNSNMESAARLKTTHAIRLKKNQEKVPVPDSVKNALEALH